MTATSTPAIARLQSFGNGLALWAAIALGVSVPVSVALDSLLLILLVAGWLLGGGYGGKLATIRRNPVALLTLGLFGLMVLGAFYGMGTRAEALGYLGKYNDLLFIGLLLPLFREPRTRSRAIQAFMGVMALTLVMSYLLWFGLLPKVGLLAERTADNPVVFKLHITQNIFMALAAYYYALHAMEARSRGGRWLFTAVALAAAYNVLFMVQGRTGYVVVAALVVYLLYVLYRRVGVRAAAVALVLCASFTVAGYTHSHVLNQRMGLAATELNAWKQGQGSQTSMGLRMDYWTNTLRIIGEHPLTGVGIGGFPSAYDQKVKGTAMAPSNNPHNQYLLIAAQIGVVGLAALLFVFYSQWRLASALPSRYECDVARGMLLAIAVGSLFNSLLLDHAEGLLYAWMTGVLYAGLPMRRET